MNTPWNTAIPEARSAGSDRRLPCGSLRRHEPHEWIGQSEPQNTYACPGAQGHSPHYETGN